MSEWYEAAIAIYLTRGGRVFIAPQYILQWDGDRKEGGSVPDFVALDFDAKEVVVVEVTTRATSKPLLAKIKHRERNWYLPISRNLLDAKIIDPSWKIRSLAFLRGDVLRRERNQEAMNDTDVTFALLEPCLHQWDYWQRRQGDGLPAKGTGIPLPSQEAPMP